MRIQSYFALGLAWLSFAPGVFSQPAGQDTRALAAFKDALDRDGFTVNPGAPIIINLVEAWCNATIPPWIPFNHALYSNSQPYLGLRVPKSAAEPAILSPIFQLAPREAIVLIGRTPPPERYFGFYPFLRTKVRSDGTRQPMWASLGDAVNNATVKTTGPSSFNSPVALIFTPDKGTDTRVRAALQRAGFPPAIINTVVFPTSLLNLGHGETADELMIVLRNAMWEKKSEGDAYINNPPLQLFRITPRDESFASPFPTPRLRVRGTGQSEMDLMKQVGTLRQRIVSAHSGLFATDIVTSPNWYEGYDYLQRGVDPWGDARDAFYLSGGYLPEFGAMEELTLADDEFLMVYGVNHAATGKASYHSFNVYSSAEGKVPIAFVEDTAFPGSTAPYLFDDPAAAKLTYAFKVSRNCGAEPYCIPLAIANCSRLSIGPNTVLGLIFRTYLEPATKVGPAMPEILYDRVIKFSPRQPLQGARQ